MAWIVVFGLLAITVGILAAVTTISAKKREEGDPIIELTLILPNGEKKWRWPK